MRKFLLDTNCFIAASRDDSEAASLETFVQRAAPGLYLSTVVAAELGAGTKGVRDLRKLEDNVLAPYAKRGRMVTPSATAWETLSRTLAWSARNDGLVLRTTPNSFVRYPARLLLPRAGGDSDFQQ
jgi:predicted nucleic acid-binding protein